MTWENLQIRIQRLDPSYGFHDHLRVAAWHVCAADRSSEYSISGKQKVLTVKIDQKTYASKCMSRCLENLDRDIVIFIDSLTVSARKINKFKTV